MTDLTLPNIRKLFIPDPGYTLIDADLQGADAQVVAWEANDTDLKRAFKEGLNVHEKNARDMFPDLLDGSADPKKIKYPGSHHDIYYCIKRAVHGTNYGGSARAIAKVLGWHTATANKFQKSWFSLHPPIKQWHTHIDHEIKKPTRTIYNKFGYRCTFFDRPENCFTEALAWIPQSTVAITTFLGAQNLIKLDHHIQMLIQVHDSLVFQIPTHLEDTLLPRIAEAVRVEIPYDDPLVIPWSFKASTKSWGDCKTIEIN